MIHFEYPFAVNVLKIRPIGPIGIFCFIRFELGLIIDLILES